jgi:hypothetical protein
MSQTTSPKSVPTTDEIPPTNPKRTRRKAAEVSRDTSLLPNPPAEDAPKLEWALAYAEQLGWALFPCNEFKEPLTSHGFNDANQPTANQGVVGEVSRRQPRLLSWICRSYGGRSRPRS